MIMIINNKLATTANVIIGLPINNKKPIKKIWKEVFSKTFDKQYENKTVKRTITANV